LYDLNKLAETSEASVFQLGKKHLTVRLLKNQEDDGKAMPNSKIVL